jgi:hypothetical protein
MENISIARRALIAYNFDCDNGVDDGLSDGYNKNARLIQIDQRKVKRMALEGNTSVTYNK